MNLYKCHYLPPLINMSNLSSSYHISIEKPRNQRVLRSKVVAWETGPCRINWHISLIHNTQTTSHNPSNSAYTFIPSIVTIRIIFARYQCFVSCLSSITFILSRILRSQTRSHRHVYFLRSVEAPFIC